MNPVNPTITRAAVSTTKQIMLAKLASGDAAKEEIEAYTDAVIAHGKGLRDRSLQRMQERWDAAGVGDAPLLNATTQLADVVNAYDTSGDPKYTQGMVTSYIAVEKMNKTRQVSLALAVAQTLSTERQLGHTLTNIDPSSQITPEDAALLNTVTSWLPSKLLEAAGLRTPNIQGHTGDLFIEQQPPNHPIPPRFDRDIPCSKGRRYELHHNGTLDTIAHELAHYIEHDNPEIQAACQSFLDRRTDGYEVETFEIDGVSCQAIEDHFASPYVGRIYDNGEGTEVFAVGVEALLTGRYSGLVGLEQAIVSEVTKKAALENHKADPEHAALILGLLATANS